MPTRTKPKKPETISDLIKLTDKENPRPEDLKRIREQLDDNAHLVEINEVSERAFNTVIKSYSSSALVKELYERQIKTKRDALGYESENVMVQMLINQMILCHMRLNTFETFHAEKTRENLSIASGLYWDRLLSCYQRRFQKACESLAKVKKLLSEAEHCEQRARAKRGQATLNSLRIVKNATSD